MTQSENSHINPAFDIAIQDIESLLAQMEATLIDQTELIHRTFTEMSVDFAKRVRKNDKSINQLQRQVDQSAASFLSLYHPMAQDMRFVIGAMKMSIEYERVGDYIKNTAKSVSRMATYDKDLKVVPKLVAYLEEITAYFKDYCQVRNSVDVQPILKLWLKDEDFDDNYKDIVKSAVNYLREENGNEYSLIHTVNIAKNIERIGDKIKNLLEISYMVQTGEELYLQLDESAD